MKTKKSHGYKTMRSKSILKIAYAPLMTLNNIAIIAITNKIWTNPPPKGETNAPKIQMIIKITAIR